MTALILGETVALLLLGILVFGLLRSHAQILRKLHELGLDLEDISPLNQEVPGGDDLRASTDDRQILSRRKQSLTTETSQTGDSDTSQYGADITGSTLDGGTIAISMSANSGNTLIAFLSSGCSTCQSFWKSFRNPNNSQLSGSPRVIIVTRDMAEESKSALMNLAPSEIPVVMSNQAWIDYGVPGAPFFVMVQGGTSKIIGEGTTKTWNQLRDLVNQAAADVGIDERSNFGKSGSFVTSLPPNASSGENQLARPLGAREREARADLELAKSGIYPGDDSLYNSKIGTFDVPITTEGQL